MRTVTFGVIVWLCAAAGWAQAPAPPSAQPRGPAVSATPAQPPAKPAPAPEQESFAYTSDGRRDPFINLLGTGPETRAVLAARSGDGPTGLLVADVAVRGIVQNRGVLVAMVQGPDKKTYLVHQGDVFADGTVKSITSQGLVIVQQVKDPLGVVKPREIHKQLRSIEDAKP